MAVGSTASLQEAEERLQEYAELSQAQHNTCQLISGSDCWKDDSALCGFPLGILGEFSPFHELAVGKAKLV